MVSGYFITTAPIDTNFGRGPVGLDLNGDNFADLVIGSDHGADGFGAVQVVYGQAGGFDPVVDLHDLTALGGFNITGASQGSELGYELEVIGDQNGDGRDDLAIVSRATGTVTVLYASDANLANIDLATGFAAANGFTISGLPVLADFLGVQSLGDFNGDGIADFMVTTSSGVGGTGTAYIVHGQSTGANLNVTTLNGTNGFAITGLNLRDTAGSNAAALGDVNADGKADVMLGSNGVTTGDLTILLGSNTAQNATNTVGDFTGQLITLTGLAANVAPGSSVSGSSDVNGDGNDDFIIGAELTDVGGVNTGSAYVVFGGAGISTTIDLTALDGTDGFAVHGLNAGDQLGQVVENLGDISGDGIGDLGLMTQSGTLYLVYGQAAGSAFPASFDLSTLNGSNGYAITGLTTATPDSLGLAALPSLNADQIRDIAISSTTVGGTAGQTVVLLGGAENLAALDAANGGTVDGSFSANALGAAVFAGTNVTTTVTGDATGSLTEDETTTTGTIGATTSIVGGTAPSFAGRTAEGTYGALVVNAAGSLWTYEVNSAAANLAILQALDEGDTLTDIITLAATDNTARKITVTIEGLNDAPFLEVASFTMTEDNASITGSLSLTDVDEDDMPSIVGQTVDGTYGKLVIDATGKNFELFLTNTAAQGLAAGETATDSFVITADDGTTHTVSLTVTGATEGQTQTFDDTDNTINTGYGNDIIAALGGNDVINTGAGDDSVSGGAGNDTIVDTYGDSTVDGGIGNDDINLTGGSSTVTGGDGSDLIRTGYQNDSISGGDGNDVINADNGALLLFGNDTVDGGTGDDLMMAGDGVDTFVFRPNDGNDIIGAFDNATIMQDAAGFTAVASAADFTAGVDKINLVGFASATSANVLSFVNADGVNAVFNAEGTTITLQGVDVTTLTVDDFLFT